MTRKRRFLGDKCRNMAPLSAAFNLVNHMDTELALEYIPARLVDYGGDLSKRWYIVFYIWNTDIDELVRKRFSRQINDYDSIRQRRQIATEYIEEINQLLKEGYTLGAPRHPEEVNIKSLTIGEAIQFIIDRKKLTLSENSMKHYHALHTRMCEYLKLRGLQKIKIKKLSTNLVYGFLDYLKEQRGSGNRNYNNHLRVLKTIVNELMRRDKKLFNENPCADIPELPVTSKKHAAYSPEQMALIKNEMLRQNDPQLLLFIQFIYFTLARPNEVQHMRVEQILMDEDKIYIPAGDSKNRQGDYVDIFAPLKQIIIESRILNYPGDYYIFSRDGKPGTWKTWKGYFRRRHNKVLKALKLNESKRRYDIYSYKHTGAINLYLSGLEIIDIQTQCRHKTLNQTMEYLRDLDMFRKKDHLDKVRGF